MKIVEFIDKRSLLFFLFFLLSVLLTFSPIKALYHSSHSEYYSHIILIPLISAYLIYLNRKLIFSDQQYSFIAAMPLLLIAVILNLWGRNIEDQLNLNNFASMMALSSVIFINGSFLLFYGMKSFKAALFPLLFLIFVIPIPSTVMDGIIYFLQVGSTECANVLFVMTGVPFLRDGFLFHLPGMSIEVAKQCSGIRSSLALLITAMLAGHLFLNSWWKKFFLVLLIVPVTMFKNGIRIVSLTIMGTYWDSRILTNSSLHSDGGIIFFVLALGILAPVLFLLRKSEQRKSSVEASP